MHFSFRRDSAFSTFDRAVRWIDDVRHNRAEEHEMLRWARRSSARANALLKVLETWESVRGLSAAQLERVERLAQTLNCEDKVIRLARSAHSPPNARWRQTRLPLSIFTCAFALAILLLCLPFNPEVPYETATGESRVLMLADGSRVHMNSATRLRIRLSKEVRLIDLTTGEALFDVAHDASRPFVVRSHESIVKALGTEFDVQRRSDDSSRIIVMSGRVELAVASTLPEHSGEVVQLSADQVATIRRTDKAHRVSVIPLSSREKSRALGWTVNAIALRDTPLREAVAEFNLHNVRQLVIDDPEIGDIRLGGHFQLSNPEHFAVAVKPLGVGVRIEPGENRRPLHLYRLADPAFPVGHESAFATSRERAVKSVVKN